MNEEATLSDAEWYFQQSKSSREFYVIFGEVCRKYGVMWSEAAPAVRDCISELVKLTLERNAAERKLEAVLAGDNKGRGESKLALRFLYEH